VELPDLQHSGRLLGDEGAALVENKSGEALTEGEIDQQEEGGLYDGRRR
jgi:hypothetical protein